MTEPQAGHKARVRDNTPSSIKVPDDMLVVSYRKTGSIHKSGAELGISSAAIHRRLTRLGAISVPHFTPDEITKIRNEYESYASVGKVNELADAMGVSAKNIGNVARKYGLTNKSRAKPWMVLMRGDVKWRGRYRGKGALGHKHDDETRASISAASKRMWATHKAFGIGNMSESHRQKKSDHFSLLAGTRPASTNYSNTKGGYRDDLGPENYFRSSWEANYARYLNLLMKMKIVEGWQYEPETFWFLEIKRGVRSYRPDFLVQYKGGAHPVYVEIKGWMDPKSKTKIARFRKFYPQHKLEVVTGKEYEGIRAKWRSAIPLWEGK